MKNLILLTSFLLISLSLLAQPSLQYPENAPVIGDITQIQFVSPTGLSTDPVGENVTWDFSQLTNLYGATIEAIDPASAPYGSLYPQANIALKMNDSTYSYCLIDESGFFYLGAQMMQSGNPIIMVYSDSRRYMRYPFDYLDTENDPYKGASNFPPVEIRATGDSEIGADSYGTVILPYGTFHDVIRLTTLDIEIDSLFVMNQFTGVVEVTRMQFHWYWQYSKSPLFSIEIVTAGAGPADTTAYYATTGAGLNDPSSSPISMLSVFPNPAEDHIKISFNTSESIGTTISIVNLLGQVISSKDILESSKGSFSEKFDISMLPSGIYFANVKCSCGKQLTEKFVIR